MIVLFSRIYYVSLSMSDWRQLYNFKHKMGQLDRWIYFFCKETTVIVKKKKWLHLSHFSKNIGLFICTKFSLERDALVKLSTESNGRQPRGREEKEKLTHIQIRCNLLDFFLSFFPNVLSNQRFGGFFPPSSGFQRVNEGNKQNASFLSLTVFTFSFFLSRSI